MSHLILIHPTFDDTPLKVVGAAEDNVAIEHLEINLLHPLLRFLQFSRILLQLASIHGRGITQRSLFKQSTTQSTRFFFKQDKDAKCTRSHPISNPTAPQSSQRNLQHPSSPLSASSYHVRIYSAGTCDTASFSSIMRWSSWSFFSDLSCAAGNNQRTSEWMDRKKMLCVWEYVPH